MHAMQRDRLVPIFGQHAIFTFEGAKVRELFVLGDIHGLIGRLKGET